MSDWQVGDLAIAVEHQLGCPNCDDQEVDPGRPPNGAVKEVAEVHIHPWLSLTGLAFVPGEQPWCSCSWRRIDKHEACEDEFVTLLKRSKRKVGA